MIGKTVGPSFAASTIREPYVDVVCLSSDSAQALKTTNVIGNRVTMTSVSKTSANQGVLLDSRRGWAGQPWGLPGLSFASHICAEAGIDRYDS
jgi:hypothetical protein